jgi:hypothetical protein
MERIRIHDNERTLFEQFVQVLLSIIPHERNDANQVQKLLNAESEPDRKGDRLSVAVRRAEQVPGGLEQSVCLRQEGSRLFDDVQGVEQQHDLKGLAVKAFP